MDKWIEIVSGIGLQPTGGGGTVISSSGVISVNGQTGVVNLTTDDVPEGSVYYTAPGGPDLFAYYDGTSHVAQLPNWNIDTVTVPNRYGLRYGVGIDPFLAGANYSVTNQFYNNLTATSAAPNDTEVLLQLVSDMDPSNTGIGFGNNGQAVVLQDNLIFAKSSAPFGSITGNNLSFSLGDNGISGGSVNGITGQNINIVATSGFTITSGFRCYNLNTTLPPKTTVVNGISGYSASLNVNCNFGNYINYYEASGSFAPTNAYGGSLQVFTNSVHIDGEVANPVVFADYTVISTSGNVTGDYRSASFAPSFQAGSTVRSYTGFYLGPTFSDFITNDARGVQINMNYCQAGDSINALQVSASSAVSTSGSVTGINIDMSGASGGTNPQGIIGIESNARLSINATTNLVSGQTVQIGNRVESLLNVPAGSAVTGSDALCNNFAGDFVARDNVALGPIGIGINSVGFIATLAVAATKTVDSFTVFLPAASLADPGFTTGGNITDFNQIRIFPPLPQGGTANITNAYAIKIDSLFGDYSTAATNTWGLYLDTDAENYIKGSLNIAGSSGVVTNSSVGLEIGGVTKAFLNARMTTTERNALTAVNGMQIYNTTTDKLQVYAAGTWVDLH